MPSLALTATLRAAILVAAGTALGGCLGPTYGTDQSAGAQFLDDLDNFAQLTPQTTQIAYAPRPELVRPDSVGALPPPQATRNTTDDPNWPESPEQRSARLRAAGDAATGGGETPLSPGVLTAPKEGVSAESIARASRRDGRIYNHNADSTLSPDELAGAGELVRQRIRDQTQGSPTQRRYLSEPPITYRQPAATAPVGDPGVDEEVKQRRLSGASEPGLFDKFKDLVPGI